MTRGRGSEEGLTVRSSAEARSADTGAENPVPLPNVTSKILSKVIEYAKYHSEAEKAAPAAPAAAAAAEGAEKAPPAAGKEEEVKAWDGEFVKVDQGTLFELILVRGRTDRHLGRHAHAPRCQAANYLDIKTLLDLTCQTVANMIKGASQRGDLRSRKSAAHLPRSRQDAGGDPQVLQHQERLLAGARSLAARTGLRCRLQLLTIRCPACRFRRRRRR